MNSITFLIFIATILNLIWSGVLTYLIVRQNQFFRRFTAGIAKNDLKTILKNIAQSMKKIGEEINRLDGGMKTIVSADRQHLQKIGFVRYNPFSDTGGDQSFCVSLLDQNDNGIVMTSLHSREQTRIYAKMVTNGQTKGYELSKEEVEAIALAMKRK